MGSNVILLIMLYEKLRSAVFLNIDDFGIFRNVMLLQI